MKRIQSAILVLLVLVAGACSRGIAVGSAEPGAAYRVAVTNSTSTVMDVTFNDGGSDKALGAVAAGRTETFVVAGARQADVTVTGRSSSRTVGPIRVSLQAGSTAKVTLR